MDWARALPYITGSVDQELLLRNGYLAAEKTDLESKTQRRPEGDDRSAMDSVAHMRGLRDTIRSMVSDSYDALVAAHFRVLARISREIAAAMSQ